MDVSTPLGAHELASLLYHVLLSCYDALRNLHSQVPPLFVSKCGIYHLPRQHLINSLEAIEIMHLFNDNTILDIRVELRINNAQ